MDPGKRKQGCALAAGALLVFGAHAATQDAQPSSEGGTASLTQARASFAPQDPPGEWRRPSRDFANTRFSPLGQIDPDNVQRLRIAWTFSDGEKGATKPRPWWSTTPCT